MVDLGTNKDCAYECQEKHIKNAVYNNKQIPTKPIEKEPYDIKGHVPNGPYTVHSISKPSQTLIYDFSAADYQFLDANQTISDAEFEFTMTVLDLMFPSKYRNVNADIGGYVF